MKKTIIIILAALCMTVSGMAQDKVEISVKTDKASGYVDPMLYGQLFEHIYFSANNGVWQELLFERSFENEHYPGIPPRDGYFDGWFMDDDDVLHSPTRYEQPIHITDVAGDDYEITMDVNWRSYRLARRAWSGGLLDIRVAFKDQTGGEPYFVRIHDPKYEVRALNLSQTESQIQAAAMNRARAAVQQQTVVPDFSISRMVESETEFRGMKRTVKTLQPIVSKTATAAQINENRDWHKLRISCKGSSATVYWDGKKVLSSSKLDRAGSNDITFWVNYTEALFRNIKVTSANGKTVYFEGTPEDVKVPAVAPQWDSFGDGTFELVKGDAVNMDYSQKITTTSQAGISQGPQNIVKGERYIGYIHAKGDGMLSVQLRKDGKAVSTMVLGKPGPKWKKYEFELDGTFDGDADFAICVENGSLQVDEASMTTKSGMDLGGFRPDIFKAVDELGPTCLRWPGGGYVAQYDWRWGIGPQTQRQRWDHWMWMDYDQNCFGTDEFIRFCREIGTEPVIVVTVGFDRPEEELEGIFQNALNWLRYCNAPATDAWGAKRAANGHPEPYNVKYWEIDNEMWEMGIEKYEAAVRKFSAAMREIDPTIKIIACGGFQEDEQFLERSANYFDYMSLHHYEQQNGYATGPQNLARQYDRYADMIAKSPNPNVKLFISEWNLNSQDWRTGLFAGGFLNVCEARDVVAMGAAALFIRRTDAPDWNNAFINFNYKDLYVAPNYQVTKLWHDHFSTRLLSFEGETADLNIVTTMSENGHDVIIKVVNPTDKPYKLTFKGKFDAAFDAVYDYYAPGDLMVGNTLEKKDAVALQQKSFKVSASEGALDIAPYSAGVITVARGR
ncbi:MAG: alpha-L-arabinofuranosidase [Bacteroidales bacterium]|nr:alpha-L-arabinofuranosidase [Bacteroidales bacterium]